jgi:hypothetical protein
MNTSAEPFSHPGTCNWCKKASKKLRLFRDPEESCLSPRYMVCPDCRSKANRGYAKGYNYG